MAGTGARVAGVIFLILGILTLAAGIAAMTYAADQQAENEERGLFEDKEESDHNQALESGGLAGIVLGLGMAILGTILMVVGGSQSRQDHERKIQLVAASSKNDSKEPIPNDNQRTGVIIGVSIFLVAVALILILTLGGGTLGLSSPFDDPSQESHYYNGTISNTIVAPFIGSQSPMTTHIVETASPESIDKSRFQLIWEPQENTAELHFAIEMLVDEEWTLLAESTVTPGTTLSVDDNMHRDSLRMTVTPIGDAYAIQDQPFTIYARYTGF